MKIEDLVVEIMGKDTVFIRKAARLVAQYAGTDKISATNADTLRRFGREYKKLESK